MTLRFILPPCDVSTSAVPFLLRAAGCLSTLQTWVSVSLRNRIWRLGMGVANNGHSLGIRVVMHCVSRFGSAHCCYEICKLPKITWVETHNAVKEVEVKLTLEQPLKAPPGGGGGSGIALLFLHPRSCTRRVNALFAQNTWTLRIMARFRVCTCSFCEPI